MLKLIPSNPDARGFEFAALQMADAQTDDQPEPLLLNPARTLLAMRDKAQALLHLEAAAGLLGAWSGVSAAEQALDDVDGDLIDVIARVRLAVGILAARAAQ